MVNGRNPTVAHDHLLTSTGWRNVSIICEIHWYNRAADFLMSRPKSIVSRYTTTAVFLAMGAVMTSACCRASSSLYAARISALVDLLVMLMGFSLSGVCDRGLWAVSDRRSRSPFARLAQAVTVIWG